MSDLFGNFKDRFSHDLAQITCNLVDRGLFEEEGEGEDDTDMFAGISAAGNNDTGTVP